MKIIYPVINPHSLSVEEVILALQTDAAKGLSQGEAEKRSTEFGQNVYQAQKQKSVFLMLLLQFKSPIVYLLLFAVAVTDIFPALALGLGKGDKSVMERPPRDPNHPIVSNKDWIAITLYALTITFAVLASVIYCQKVYGADTKVANNIAFISLAFAQLFHVFNMSSFQSNLVVNDVTKNKFVWFALLICSALLILVFALPQMRLVLGLQVIDAEVWFVSMIGGLIPLVLIQVYKIISGYKKRNKEPLK